MNGTLSVEPASAPFHLSGLRMLAFHAYDDRWEEFPELIVNLCPFLRSSDLIALDPKLTSSLREAYEQGRGYITVLRSGCSKSGDCVTLSDYYRDADTEGYRTCSDCGLHYCHRHSCSCRCILCRMPGGPPGAASTECVSCTGMLCGHHSDAFRRCEYCGKGLCEQYKCEVASCSDCNARSCRECAQDFDAAHPPCSICDHSACEGTNQPCEECGSVICYDCEGMLECRACYRVSCHACFGGCLECTAVHCIDCPCDPL